MPNDLCQSSQACYRTTNVGHELCFQHPIRANLIYMGNFIEFGIFICKLERGSWCLRVYITTESHALRDINNLSLVVFMAITLNPNIVEYV